VYDELIAKGMDRARLRLMIIDKLQVGEVPVHSRHVL
jgi:hypothetical protein